MDDNTNTLENKTSDITDSEENTIEEKPLIPFKEDGQLEIEDSDYVSPLTVGDYVIMWLILLIPLINIVMPFVWAFGDYNPNKRNFAKSLLILWLILIFLFIILAVVFVSIGINFSRTVIPGAI